MYLKVIISNTFAFSLGCGDRSFLLLLSIFFKSKIIKKKKTKILAHYYISILYNKIVSTFITINDSMLRVYKIITKFVIIYN